MKARINFGGKRVRQRVMRLQKEAEREGKIRVARRLHGIRLNLEGYTSGEISRVLNVHRGNVSLWLKNWQDQGLEGILEGQRCGRPCELSGNQIDTLSDILDSGPIAYGYESGVWTSKVIAQVIAEEFGVFYHPGHVRKILYQMKGLPGFVWVKTAKKQGKINVLE
jgi:transposase